MPHSHVLVFGFARMRPRYLRNCFPAHLFLMHWQSRKESLNPNIGATDPALQTYQSMIGDFLRYRLSDEAFARPWGSRIIVYKRSECARDDELELIWETRPGVRNIDTEQISWYRIAVTQMTPNHDAKLQQTSNQCSAFIVYYERNLQTGIQKESIFTHIYAHLMSRAAMWRRLVVIRGWIRFTSIVLLLALDIPT